MQGKDWKQRPDAFYPVHNPKDDIWYPCDPDAVWRFSTKSRVVGKKIRTMPIESLAEDNRILWKPELNPAFYKSETELLNAIKAGTAPPNLKVYLQLDELKRQIEAGEAPP